MISTRGRYALRVLVDLAENQGDGYITLKEVAEGEKAADIGSVIRLSKSK